MKAVNIKSWAKSPRVQKWGLFALLALTLGFNLSMNPEHFNNIARIEKPEAFQSTEMASNDHAGTEQKIIADNEKRKAGQAALKETGAATTSPAVTATTTTSTVIETKSVATNSLNEVAFLCKNKDNGNAICNAKITKSKSENGDFVAIAKIEGGDCEKCTGQTITVTSKENLDHVDLIAKIAEKAIAPEYAASDSKDKKDKKDKKAKLSSEDLMEKENLIKLGEACKKKPKEGRLTCHSEMLIKLSKQFDDSSEAKKALKTYFEKFVLIPLRDKYFAPTVNSTSLTIDLENSNEAEEIAKQLVEDLNPENSQEILTTLTKLKKATYTVQAGHSQELLLLSQSEIKSTDPYTMFHGRRMEQLALAGLNPIMLRNQLRYDTANWEGYMRDGDKDFGPAMLRQNLYSPVTGFLNQLDSVARYQNTGTAGTQTTLAQRLSRFAIPDFSGANYPTNSNLNGIYSGFARGYNPQSDLAIAWLQPTSFGSHTGCTYSPLYPDEYSLSNRCLDSGSRAQNRVGNVNRGRVGRVRQ